MKAKGATARSGDVIPYVFCLGDGGESSKSAQAERAKHPDEIRRAGSELKIGESPHSQMRMAFSDVVLPLDYEYYLSQQILPPSERLCEPIEGTDRSRLAECLGKSQHFPACRIVV